ncbi:GTP cyclohydrolase II [Alcaligenaceae bacterium]|nr:GTP cyclohydrolase II [Alcaligenaceae bacterium]
MQPLHGAGTGVSEEKNTTSSGAGSAAQQLDYMVSSKLPTPWATFGIHVFVEAATGKEHLALTLGDIGDGRPVLARVHSECLTGDALFSQRCDCGAQLETALKAIADEGRGALLYMRQEGRGIGLVNKIRAYQLQDGGADTVEANERLGFPADMRRYDLCKPMLDHFGIVSLRLMTNNPRKVNTLESLGVPITERIPLQVNRNPHNENYLSTKAAKLGHWLKKK